MREKHHVVFDLHLKKIAVKAVCAAKTLSKMLTNYKHEMMVRDK